MENEKPLDEIKRSIAEAMKLRNLIVEKLNTLKGIPGDEHDSGNIFYKFGLYIPEPVILAALGALNDRCHNDRLPFLKGDGAERYFMACIRRMCAEQKIKTGIKKWDVESGVEVRECES